MKTGAILRESRVHRDDIAKQHLFQQNYKIMFLLTQEKALGKLSKYHFLHSSLVLSQSHMAM